MLVKICGLTRTSDAELAESLGADFLGVIMAGGPRNLSEANARTVLGPRRHSVRRVAVFGSQKLSEIAEIANRIDLDVVQLHGTPGVADIAWLRDRINCAVWPVLRVEGTVISSLAIELAEASGALLLDAKVVGQLGGTGVQLDWRGLASGVQSLRVQMPKLLLILAGGLNASNVAEAERLLSPDVVDVSSGVESAPGLKDEKLLHAFMAAVRTSVRKSSVDHPTDRHPDHTPGLHENA